MLNATKLMLVALATGLMLAGLQSSALAAEYTWSGPTTGAANWNNAANWGGVGVPNGTDDVANLTMDVTGALTINLDVPVTLGALIDGDDDTGGETPNPIVLAGNALTFDVSSGNAAWTHAPVGDATVDITAPVFLEDSIDIYNETKNYNSRMEVHGGITTTSANLKTILYNGNSTANGQPYIRLYGAITDGAGQLGVTMQATYSGSALYLDSNSNSFTGEVLITAASADFIVSTPNSLGSPTAGTTVENNSSLYLRASVSDEPMTISGQGARGAALLNGRNAVTFGSLITLAGDSRIGAGAYSGSGADLTLDVTSGNAVEGDFNLAFNSVYGPITVNDPIAIGPGGLTKQGNEPLTLNAVNRYYGDTDITAGTLSMANAFLNDASYVSIKSGALMDLDFSGNDMIAELILDGTPMGPGTYNSSTHSEYFTGAGSLEVVGPVEWDGGVGNWNSANWSSGQLPSSGPAVIINADSGDSEVTVNADVAFDDGNGTGPVASVFVGEEYDAKLTVAGGVTLEVAHATTASEFGKIAVNNAAVLRTASAVIEPDGKYIAGVQGAESGLLKARGQLSLEEVLDGVTGDVIAGGADAVQVDWMPGADATSMFGGTYRIAEYTGDALTTEGITANENANIGVAYIKSVDYDVDVEGDQSLWAVDVELHDQGLGDTDLDADVDGDDLATFGLAWAPSGTDKTWFDGDFDFDGDIDGDDLAALGLAWAPSGIDFPAGELEVTAVPEPGTAVMLLLAAAGLLIYRKRR